MTKKERKMKGRYVFQGNQVRDEYNDVALFASLGSQPATMEGSKIVDAWGLMPGHDEQQADAQQAYVQSDLGGSVQTFVSIPEEYAAQQPGWSKFRNPVCLLVKALYGHPDAGTYWEKHCDEKLKECGFKRITDWDSLYYHKEHRCVLMVYVDDFKLSGPAEKLPAIWEQIGKKIDLDEPKGVDRCLGCKHIVTDGFRNGAMVVK